MFDSPDSAGQDRPSDAHDSSSFSEGWQRRPADAPGFRSRRDAGVALAQAFASYAGRKDVLVLALSPSSVHVASEVARSLDSRLDLFLASRLTAPGHDQLAIGAVTTGGNVVLNRELMERLRIPASVVRDAAARARADVERRERVLRGDRAPIDPTGFTVLLVADSIATGASMLSAIAALRKAGAARVIAGVPVAPPETCAVIRRAADEVVCLHTPKPYYGAGAWFDDFREPSAESTRELLVESATRFADRAPSPLELPPPEPS
ncbi:MAG TPA: phosphoribosyltransferase family protein [Gemmatimonadaceae bacterium]|nr:phosphoribosyltransferase family protein [Gemmatimonadaceae bacterium]